MTNDETPDTVSAQGMVSRLMDTEGMTADQISYALHERVSRRTVYRWKKGESYPQQPSDLLALRKLYQEKTEGRALCSNALCDRPQRKKSSYCSIHLGDVGEGCSM